MSIKITNDLLKKYAENLCNAEEKLSVERWYNEYASKKEPKSLNATQIDEANQQIWGNINRNLKQPVKLNVTFLKVAATILLFAGVSFVVYKLNNRNQISSNKAQANFEIGSVKAEVYTSKDRLVVSGNADIKTIMSKSGVDQEIKIKTQVGEEYHAFLPDGSEIWLNANSEIVIPVNYNKGYRNINLLKGEAYFKVAKDKTKPFRVFAAKTQIEALGTEFNVSYYAESKSIKAFLVEGSISVSKKNELALIKPNQLYQSDNLTDESSVNEIENPATQYAWKSGYFDYSNTPIQEILEDLSRWYNFDFEIHPSYKNKTLTGKISRKQPFNEVLAILEFSGIKYRKEGSKLILAP